MNFAETIFFGGDIITVDDRNPAAKALAVGDGKILAVGEKEGTLQLKGPETRMVDLQGKSLMPGLIEPHSHPIISALLYDWVDVSGFNNASAAEVINRLRGAVARSKPGEWICAFGYDSILVRELRTLTADFLDTLSTVHPILVMIQSMHTVYVNHLAFDRAGITDNIAQPPGGIFVKDRSGKLTGMVVEQGAILPIMAAMLNESIVDGPLLMRHQLQRYALAGYTTIGAMGDFGIFPEAVSSLKQMVENRSSPVRMVFMNKAADMENAGAAQPECESDRFSVRGVKFWYDGSPYTGNMYLDEQFLNSRLMQQGLGIPEDTCGYSMMPKQKLQELVRKYHDAGHQLAIHGQGDRAIREIIDVYEDVLKASPREDHRHRIEHGALFPLDQLDRARRLGVTPSWHINHIHYYGEALRDEIIGPDRARRLMPIGSALAAGHTNSLHNDSPMYPAEPFKLMRTAVTRKTRNNVLIGPDQAVTVDDAIKAVTINAAWQLFLEDKVGSLEVGKLADLVVLSKNPQKISPELLDQIRVIETYSNGKRFSFSE